MRESSLCWKDGGPTRENAKQIGALGIGISLVKPQRKSLTTTYLPFINDRASCQQLFDFDLDQIERYLCL